MPTIKQINQITDADIKACGYDIFINYQDYFTAVTPMTFGKGRIIIAASTVAIDNAWCYQSLFEAITIHAQWHPVKQKEPEGWFRNPFDGRRRKNGDPTKETNRR